MQLIALFKMLPYIGVAGLALTAFFLYIRGNILAKQKRCLEEQIEGLIHKLKINEKNAKAAVELAKDLALNKKENKELMEKLNNVEDNGEIFNIINDSIRVRNED